MSESPGESRLWWLLLVEPLHLSARRVRVRVEVVEEEDAGPHRVVPSPLPSSSLGCISSSSVRSDQSLGGRDGTLITGDQGRLSSNTIMPFFRVESQVSADRCWRRLSKWAWNGSLVRDGGTSAMKRASRLTVPPSAGLTSLSGTGPIGELQAATREGLRALNNASI